MIASNAVDGNTGTFWASKNPSEIEIDLEGYYKVSKINLMAYFGAATEVDRSYDYEIYGSTDQKTYSLLAEKKTGELETVEGTTYTLDKKTYRYIKVKILKTTAIGQPTNNTGHIKELQVYGEEDTEFEKPVITTNVAIGKTAYSSSNESGHGAPLAIDNNASTYWSASGESSLEVDLEGYYDIESINLLPYYSDKRYYHYEIYTSIDGLDYTKVAEKKTDELQTAAGDSYSFEKQTVRYVRVNMLHNSLNPSMHICELRVMGVKNDSYVPPEEPEDIDNIAKGKPTRSYSNEASRPASAINDGELKTKWTALYYPAYVDIDLEKNYDLSKIQVIPDFSDMSVYYQYSVFGSMNGRDFYPIIDKQDKQTVTRTGNTFDLSNVEARIVRVYLENVSKGNTGSINEVKMYGKPTDTALQERPAIEVTDFKDSVYAGEITQQETIDSVKGIVTRTVGPQYLEWFDFVIEDKADDENDYYEISNKNGKIQIKGNKGISLSTGLNHYLKYYCNVSITQQARQVKMPDAIVPVDKTITKETPYAVRYAYNYCTHSYTMAFWGEAEWQNELDYLALNGFNVILDITGQEEVYRKFLKELGYSDDEAKDWLVGPSYYGWQYMANMENVNGPVPDNWFENRVDLARKNQRQMRALGMEPIMQGYSGMVPNSIKDKDSNAETIAQGLWNGMQRPAMLKTTSETFDKYADIFYRVQEEVYGDISDYYATDPFHEGGNPGGIGRDVVGRRVLDAMKKVNDKAIWVIQSWSFQPALLQNISAEEKINNILLLDLNGTKAAKYGSTNEFASSNWVYCMLENYGGRNGIAGNLEKYTKIPSQVKDKTKYMKGIGISPEGTNNNPVKYDLFLEMMWEDKDIDLDTWIQHYVRRRYGADSEQAQKAWELLLETAYINSSGYADPPESVINARPRFNATQSAPNGSNNIHYSKQKFEKALQYLMSDYDMLKNSEGYAYDVTDFVRQAIANSAQNEYNTFTGAYNAKDKAKFAESSKKFLDMVALQDRVLSANKNFTVGTWLNASKGASEGQDPFTQKIFQMNSKGLISSWAPYYCWGVYDYANREYGGLTKDYYLKRWNIWIDRLSQKLAGKNVNIDYGTSEAQQLAWEWAREDKEYPSEASGENLLELYTVFKDNFSLIDENSQVVNQLDIKVSTELPSMGNGYDVGKLMDGNSATFWSSDYGDLEPYDVYFEFDQAYTINKFTQLPRPGGGNGNILGIELYASDDGTEYHKIAEDTYINDANEKATTFAPIKTKYMKLHIKDFLIYNNNHDIKSVTCAEVNFYKAEAGLTSDVYELKNGKVSGVKENTTVSQFVKQVNIPAGKQVVVQRNDVTLENDDKVLANDVVKLMKGETVVESYIVDMLEASADFTELNELIKEYESFKESEYTVDSWKAYAEVLSIAIGVQVNPEASNKEIQEACTNLRVAAGKLVSIKALIEAIAQKDTLEAADYTTASWIAYEDVHEDAKAIRIKSNATKKEVSDILAQLLKLQAALVERGDTKALADEIKKADDLRQADYTNETWAVYTAALDAAKAAVKDNSNVSEEQVAELLKNLVAAFAGLKDSTVFTKELLKSAIDKAVVAQASEEFKKVVPLVQELVKSTCMAAQVVYDDVDATNEQCLDAWLALAGALQYLDFVTMDKTELLNLINACKLIDTAEYKEGVEAFVAALANAEEVYANANALAQTIQNAFDDLSVAKAGLVKNETINKAILEGMIESIEKKVGDGSKYKKDAAYQALVKALAEAKAVIENKAATQVDVNNAANTLAEAYMNIRLLPSEEQLAQLQSFVNTVNRMNRKGFTAQQLKTIDETVKKANAMLDDFNDKEYPALEKAMTETLKMINEAGDKNSENVWKQETERTSHAANPNTGDVTNNASIMLLCFVSGCGLMFILRKRNRKA